MAAAQVGATISYFVTTFVLGDYMSGPQRLDLERWEAMQLFHPRRKRLAANSQLYQKFEVRETSISSFLKVRE
jgi:hypothetical protein